MDHRARESYLEAQILTATPQKLRLMLIEAAIGAARQTRELWAQARFSEATESLIRCRNIVSELLSGIKPGDDPLCRRVTGIYVFLFKALTEAQLRRDEERLMEAIRVLEIDRETWRQVCEQVPHAPQLEDSGSSPVQEITSADANRLLADQIPRDQGPPTGGLTLDA